MRAYARSEVAERTPHDSDLPLGVSLARRKAEHALREPEERRSRVVLECKDLPRLEVVRGQESIHQAVAEQADRLRIQPHAQRRFDVLRLWNASRLSRCVPCGDRHREADRVLDAPPVLDRLGVPFLTL